MTIAPLLPGTLYGAEPRGYGPALPFPPRWIVIHDTSNAASARDEAHYAANRNDPRADWTSAHFYVDQVEVVGSVPLLAQAWAAFAQANGHGWHIEMCGKDAGQPGAVSNTTLQRTAELVAKLCRLAGIPVAHVGPAGIANGTFGIAGHLDFTIEEHRAGGHTDPGYSFDWHDFLVRVAAATAVHLPPPVPTPSGDIVSRLPTLARGAGLLPADPDQHVRVLQTLANLACVGVPGAGPDLNPDGRFGDLTDAKIRFVQVHFHVAGSVKSDGTGDGIAGPGTWGFLLHV